MEMRIIIMIIALSGIIIQTVLICFHETEMETNGIIIFRGRRKETTIMANNM